MKTDVTKSRRMSRFVVALGALALGLLGTGCEPECKDALDCQSQNGNPGSGKRYVCEDERCQVRDVTQEPPADGGTDGGTDTDGGTTTDGGTDAGVSCADLPHDPKLGTLRLQTGFTAAESATLAEDISAVTAVRVGSGHALYGVRDTDKSVYALGTWPGIATSTLPLQAIIAEEDRSVLTFLSGSIANDGQRLLTGYTKLGDNAPGNVLLHDLGTPASAAYLSAPGNFTADAVPGAFLLNGLGLVGASADGSGVYALKTGSTPYTGAKLATFPVTGTSSGFTAVTTDGIAVLGYSVYPDNSLRAVTPAVYTPHLSAGTTFELGDASSRAVFTGGGLLGMTAFGRGVVLRLGAYDQTTYEGITRELSRIPLFIDETDANRVLLGTLTPVITTSNTCTNVVLMTPFGADLLVGVKDKNGRRLVRLQGPGL